MNNPKLIAFWMVLVALIKKLLKYLSVPFLIVFYILKWICIVIVGVLALVYALIASILRGDWKV